MPRLPRKFDPQALEKEYVTTDVSIRALALKHGVSWSTVASWAKKENWSGKRHAYKSSLSRQTYEVTAAVVANETAQIQSENIAILRAGVRTFARQLASGEVKLSPKDAVEFVRELKSMTETPDEAKEASIVSVSAPADAEFFRRLLETARKRLATTGPVEGTDPSRPEKPRPN